MTSYQGIVNHHLRNIFIAIDASTEGIFSIHHKFWDSFWGTFWDPFWGPFWGPFWNIQGILALKVLPKILICLSCFRILCLISLHLLVYTKKMFSDQTKVINHKRFFKTILLMVQKNSFIVNIFNQRKTNCIIY